jgi:exodeoxyribonuclease VII large subunit
MNFNTESLAKHRVLGVGELNLAARLLLEKGFPLLWVRGEISNFVNAASGHWYFSLKDANAQVRCVIFRHKSQYLDWKPKNGMLVEVLALVTLYEARGEFQLTLEQMRPAGLGALYEAFERLKQKLEGEGLFDAGRKRTLPTMPAQVGIVTSPQAAALRDVLTTLAKRMPSISVVLYPTPVQGEGAALKIAQAIKLANERAECDVLIVCRGGGSIEDLWAFNEECVARAIAASVLPIISGVGHETDFTIADFVADERAPTPTAAAQRAVPEGVALLRQLSNTAQHLWRAQRNRLQNAMQSLDYLQRRLVHPAQQLQNKSARLSQLQQQLQRSFAYGMQRRHWQWLTEANRWRGVGMDFPRLQDKQHNLAERLIKIMKTIQQQQAVRLENAAQNLASLNPHQVLARGYSMVHDLNGKLIVDANTVMPGEELRITFAQGSVRAAVKEKEKAGEDQLG